MSDKYGGPAFPRQLPKVSVTPDEALRIIQEHAGMSLRDYFAAHAMNAPWGEALTPEVYPDGVVTQEAAAALAESCYAVADAMLKERAK
jgi:hypothetical protein